MDELTFVHACYDADKLMAERSNSTLQWEFVNPETMRAPFSGEIVIVGHTAQTSGCVLDVGVVKVIETDAFGGGLLTSREGPSGPVSQTNGHRRIRRIDPS
jgi:hypothetical protein